jgi:hypothetical protein
MNQCLIAISALALLSVVPATGQRPAVQVGYCSSLKNVDAAKAAGFEYLELATTEVAGLSDEDFEKLVKRLEALGHAVPDQRVSFRRR